MGAVDEDPSPDPLLSCDECGKKGALDLGYMLLCEGCAENEGPGPSEMECRRVERQQRGIGG